MPKKRNSLEHKLRNKYDRETLLKRLRAEPFQRVTISFYKYVPITNPQLMRNAMYVEWEKFGVFGRVYIANEGINAQISVPEHHFEAFKADLYSYPDFDGVRLNTAIEHNESFLKLTIKVKKQIVRDRLPEGSYDFGNAGKHLTAEEFNAALEDPESICIDMRNFYETRIGKFEGAVCPDVDTFEEELKEVTKILDDKKDKKVLMYCTGGIRCEKASAYLKAQGYEDVNQLEGGIIKYKRDAEKLGIESKFKGKNFVFDERRAEKITDDVVGTCDQCGASSDEMTNCHNVACNLLFIQCETCAEKYEGCCTPECQTITHLPEIEQKRIRKKEGSPTHEKYKSRLRPKLEMPV